VSAALETDTATGLDSSEAVARLDAYGANELREGKGKPPWLLFLEQFANTMLVVLMVAAAITAAIGDVKDTVVIMAIVVLSGIVGFVQEYRAERAMAALRELTSPTARVVRDGEVANIRAAEVVPGDLVLLEAGDIVAADLRLVESRSLRVNEAPLTGESEPAAKIDDALPDSGGETLLAEQRNMAFKGTTVTFGRGSGIVVSTGMATALGRIAELLQEHPAGKTPLQRRLAVLGKRLAAAAVVVCVVVFAAGVARGESVELMFLTAVSLAVAAIPEALPAVVTVSLALGAQRMARRRALVRKLPAVETLGSVMVVCSDKTGTLTQNRMLVERVWTPVGEYQVTGVGYEPSGNVEGASAPDDRYLALAARVAAACNDARLHAPATPDEAWTIDGDPTEGAMLAFAGKLGVERGALEMHLPRVAEIAFDASRMRMVTLHRDGSRVWVAVKGALEPLAVLADPSERRLWDDACATAERYASEGYRVLALAERPLDSVPRELEEAERGLRLVGIVGMADPPRPESADAVVAAREAGITPVMITGDHALTAQAIARRIGIATESGRTLTGAELDALDDESLEQIVADVTVYARTTPEQKLRIVGAWKRHGAVVAMTGDGVNDAPALRRADIGVAMGITGTEVSKEAADMVLADDNFATIVIAVEEGRRIYDNIRRFVRYLLTTNSGEIWVMFLAPFLGLPFPLLPIHILWINLVTDGLPAIALGLEPAERNTMRRPPRPPTESLFARGLWQHAIWVGVLMAVLTLGVQSVAIGLDWEWQTMTFTTLALLQLGHALAVRSERESFFRLGWRTNKPLIGAVVLTAAVQLLIVYSSFLQPVFDTEALGAAELAVVLAVSTLVFVAVEIEKWIIRRRG
jgi:Ca2+-transporting ATPase